LYWASCWGDGRQLTRKRIPLRLGRRVRKGQQYEKHDAEETRAGTVVRSRITAFFFLVGLNSTYRLILTREGRRGSGLLFAPRMALPIASRANIILARCAVAARKE